MKLSSLKKQYLCIFFIILFGIQNYLQERIGIFQYVDELFALMSVPAFLYWVMIEKNEWIWSKKKKLFFGFIIIFWICGWGGSIFYHYQPFLNTIKDAYVNIKFFMAVGASFFIFADDSINFKQLKKKLWPFLYVIVSLLFILCLLDLCFGIFSTETRAGMRAVKMFYSTYTGLVGECVFLSAICLWFFKEQKRRILPLLSMLVFIMLSTRRVKAMGALACLMVVYLLVFYKWQKISRKMKVLVGGVVAIAVIVGVLQMVYYYGKLGTESARAVLTLGAPFVAKDHFPFGTGWGTYGSAFSIEPYSPVYGAYHMDRIWGMSANFNSYISDTFWPMILGQTGFFGFLAYVGAMVIFTGKIYRLRKNKNAFSSGIFLFLYLLIASTSESAFVNPIAIPMAFWIGLLFAEQYVKENRQRRSQIEHGKKSI